MVHRQKYPPNVGRMGWVCWQTSPNPQDKLFQFLTLGTQYGSLNMQIIVKPQGHSKSTNKPCSLLWSGYLPPKGWWSHAVKFNALWIPCFLTVHMIKSSYRMLERFFCGLLHACIASGMMIEKQENLT